MRRLVPSLLVVTLMALSGCAGSRAPTAPPVDGALADWTTYHRTKARTGYVATAPRGPLQSRWSKGLTGAV